MSIATAGEPAAQRGGAPSIATAFAILDHLAAAGEAVSLIEIVQALKLPKSTTFRVLGTLESVGAVTRGEHDKRYNLGAKFTDYARAAPTPSVVSRFLHDAGPILRTLDETAQFGVLTGVNVTFLACIDSTKPVRLVSYVGRTLPAHASATGKAILAFSSQREIDAVIGTGLPPLTDHTITSADRLLAELERIREVGYATECEESTSNLSCIAAPVLTDAGKVLGAITICVPRATLPTSRFTAMKDAIFRARDTMMAAGL